MEPKSCQNFSLWKIRCMYTMLLLQGTYDLDQQGLKYDILRKDVPFECLNDVLLNSGRQTPKE